MKENPQNVENSYEFQTTFNIDELLFDPFIDPIHDILNTSIIKEVHASS